MTLEDSDHIVGLALLFYFRFSLFVVIICVLDNYVLLHFNLTLTLFVFTSPFFFFSLSLFLLLCFLYLLLVSFLFSPFVDSLLALATTQCSAKVPLLIVCSDAGFSKVPARRNRPKVRVRQNRPKVLPPGSLTAAQPFRTKKSIDSSSAATGRPSFQQLGCERPNTPMPPGTPSFPAMWLSTTYRISNFEITVSEHDIRRLLQALLMDTGSVARLAPSMKPRIRPPVPASVDLQTVVATFRQRLNLQNAQSMLKRCKPAGQLDPMIDDKFWGITPLSSPWYDPEVLQEAASASKSKVAGFFRYCIVPLFSSTKASPPLQSIRFE